MKIKQPTDNQQTISLPSLWESYYNLSLFVSCVVLCCLVITYLWPISEPVSLTTLILTANFAVIRLIQRNMSKRNTLPATPGTTIIIDQLFLSLVTFAGSPGLLILPFSSLLMFSASHFGRRYLLLAMATASVTLLTTLQLAPSLQMEILVAIPLSLVALLPSALRLNRQHPKNSEVENSVSQNASTENLQPSSEKQLTSVKFEGGPVEKQSRRILILSRNSSTVSQLTEQLINWGHETTTCDNSLQAFKHMLSRRKGEVFTPYSFLIVDGENLDIEPISLVRLVKKEELLSELRLICLQSSFYNEKYSQRLLKAGYHTLLESPWTKEQLFSIISYEKESPLGETDNIISFAKHRTIKKAYTRQKEILLADIPTPERNSLAQSLTQAGYIIHTVDNGNQALDALEEQFYDLAIINMKLPVMSGTQVVKLHRFTTPYKQWVPFIFMHDDCNNETLNISQSIGVDIYLFKPFTPQEAILSILAALDKGDLQNLTCISRNRDPIQFKNNRILDAMLLDHATLLRLEKLDSGISFIDDLFKIFEADGRIILHQMELAVAHQQFGDFLDNAQILLDSAGQLGAIILYELGQQASKLSNLEFEYKGADLLNEIQQTFNLTLQGYAHYHAQRTAALNALPTRTSTPSHEGNF
ncbi:MAG: response regulator [Candidatus Thiodiazotropha sp.]